MVQLLLLALLTSFVSAHSIFQELWIAGKDKTTSCIRLPKNNSPVTDVNSPDMRCNVGGAAGVPGLCNVEAGQNITVEMHQQLKDRRCGKESAISGRHFGPVMVYMCSVPDAKASNGDCLWVKMAEDSYAGTEDSWGTEILNKNCGKKSFTVPKILKAGQYLVRAEALALHTAAGIKGAQFYMSCYQIQVAGPGLQHLPAGVKFPGAYKQNDPSVLVNIYGGNNLKYIAPGPKVWNADISAHDMENPVADSPTVEAGSKLPNPSPTMVTGSPRPRQSGNSNNAQSSGKRPKTPTANGT